MKKNKFIGFWAGLFILCGVLAFAHSKERYVIFPINSDRSYELAFDNKKDSRALSLKYNFAPYGSKAFTRKASRVFSKQIIEDSIATYSFSVVDKWEQTLDTLKTLDLEAEEYKGKEELSATSSLRIF